MPGFAGIITLNEKTPNFDLPTTCIGSIREDLIINNNLWLKRFVVPKFLHDKLWEEDENTVICTDGVILNFKDLMNKYSAKSRYQLFKEQCKFDAGAFLSECRGNFAGCIYDKSTDKVTLFTNHIGSKPLYYFLDKDNKCLIFSTELKMVSRAMKTLGYDLNLSVLGAYYILTFGFMIDDETVIEGVKKLSPGSFLEYDGRDLLCQQYYKLGNTPYWEQGKDKLIDGLEERFREAVKKEYDKDLEYGYGHIATLSGGLDSRMNVTYARKLGYQDLLTHCFSQSNYADELIAKQIASDYGYDFLFHSLDNGNYLKDIDSPLICNDGMILYSGSAHTVSTEKLINWDHYGLLHTGQIGDLVLGSYLMEDKHKKPSAEMVSKASYSTKLIDKICYKDLTKGLSEYETDEMYAFYERCVNGVINGDLAAYQFTESASPFLYVDFLEYSFRITPRLRYKEKIYIDWIKKNAPEAVKYPWEKTGLRIDCNQMYQRTHQFWKRGTRFLRRKLFGPSSRDSMNPFDYWYKSNPALKNFFNGYVHSYANRLDGYPELAENAKMLFETGKAIEKTQVMTLLGAMHLHDLS